MDSNDKLRGRELIAAWCICLLGSWLLVYAIGYGLYLLVRMLWR